MTQSLHLPEQPETALADASGSDGFRPRALRLPSSVTQLRVARRYARDAARAFGFEGEALFAAVVAVNEAVTNAIRHGRPDTEGMIGLRITAEGDCLTFTVRDRGPFLPRVPDGGALNDHGRGFGLMATMMDEFDVSVNEPDTVVRLTKRRPSAQA